MNFDVDISHLFDRFAGAILNSPHDIRVTKSVLPKTPGLVEQSRLVQLQVDLSSVALRHLSHGQATHLEQPCPHQDHLPQMQSQECHPGFLHILRSACTERNNN